MERRQIVPIFLLLRKEIFYESIFHSLFFQFSSPKMFYFIEENSQTYQI